MAKAKSTKKEEKKPKDAVLINRPILARALNAVTRIVNPSAVLPLLTNVLIECSNGNSSVAGTDLEIGVRFAFSASGVPIRTCIPAKTFQAFVDSMNSEEITMQMNEADQSVVITTESSKSNIKCISPEDFPEISTIENPQLVMPTSLFKQMVNRIAFAALKKEEQNVLEGVLMLIEPVKENDKDEDGDKKFVMFAADRQRAAYEETTSVIIQDVFKAVVRASTLETIARILPEDEMVEIEVRENKILFHCEGVDVISQLMNGEFPSHKMIAASVKDRSTVITVNTLELLRACKQLKIFANETGATILDIQSMAVRYSTMKHERGDSDISMFVQKEGDDLEVGLNVFFLHEVLEIVKTGQVLLSFMGAKKPILVRMEGNEEFFYIIMPLHIK
jgi:DNA polymerase-3 subunit beta